jgi:tol-pal system protein YbgF
LLLAVSVGLPLATKAWAQTSPDQMSTLLDRVDRLQRDLNTLQRPVYQGGSQPSGSSNAAVPAPVPGSVATTLELRIQDLEEQLQNLRGQLEEASFQNKSNADRLDKLSSDVDYRLGAIEKKIGLSPGDADASASPSGGTAQPQSTVLIPPNAADAGAPAADAAAQQQAALPAGAPKDQYAYAFGLLNQNDYAGGEKAFKELLAQHPTDPLAANAQYWLGRTYFARNNFNDAVRTFAEGYKRYPQGRRAPENLLYLGRSLAAINQKTNACQAYSRMLSEYPKAADATKASAQAERKKLACS